MKDIAKEILQTYKKIAVVGLSPEPSRPSFGVTQYMQDQGYKIIPVRPGGGEILGEKCVDSLVDIKEPIEIVNVFRRPEFVPQIVDEAIRLGAKALWLQEGVCDPVSEHRAMDAGILVISDRCILKEHYRIK